MAVCDGLVASMEEPATISDIIHKAISERVFPGAAVAFGSCTVPCYFQAYGTYTFESNIVVRPESIWDMASLTKVMVTIPSIMLLYDRRMIDLESVACKYVPEFGSNGKNIVTVCQLLTHTAGLREFYPFFDMGLLGQKEVLEYIMNDKLWYTVGGQACYSDLSMIVLGVIIERVTGVPLDKFVLKEFFEPLCLQHTGFRPFETSEFDPLVVPTEVDRLHRNRLLWGEVHDPTAFLLGGVAGHAGLFSTIVDVCRFAQMILAGGIDLATNRRFLKESTVRLFTTPGLKTLTNPRPFALGWDVAARKSIDGYTSAGKLMGSRTFGHTGFTGTSLWIDPDRNFFVALLTNAVHPTEVGGFGSKIREVRPMIADAAVLAIGEQAIPRETLTWHLASLRYESLPLDQAEMPIHSGSDELLYWHQDYSSSLHSDHCSILLCSSRNNTSGLSCGSVSYNELTTSLHQQVPITSVATPVVIRSEQKDVISSRGTPSLILRLVPVVFIAIFVHFIF
ncbi:hypothetical protein O6H91_04G112600 [Diphasiastrum complanatum]|uniref:Uncharacterized protein n=1 Tax=Diphasiastrum complanatum TaxID=34168 RepID=A0ACC2E0F7_DIPCM|nr:hypothetical protein O6H91_04G112600 [Diphasiastrum complanatum]